MNGTTIKCAVNPKLGYEREYNSYKKETKSRKVAVIGGGPAGMESAITLAKRGFEVTLYEKKDHLGGSVYTGSTPPHKDRLNALIESMEYQINKLNINLKLNTSPTIKDLKELNPYAVFVAVGGKDIIPPLPGVDNENVYLATNILEEEINFENKNITVVGSGMTGLETAEYLDEQGNNVKVIEMKEKIGPGVHEPVLYDTVTRLKKQGVELLPSRRLTKIENNSITVENTIINEEEEINIDSVVLALGIKDSKESEFVQKIENNFSNVKILGDAKRAGKIYNAVKTAFDKSFVL